MSDESQAPKATVKLHELLRAELEHAPVGPQRAAIYHELGHLEASFGNESGAAKDWLAAHADAPDMREPLEDLTRVLVRRKSLKNLAAVLQSLVDAPASSAERASALWFRSSWVDASSEERQALLLEAAGLDPANATLWLELEALASQSGDTELRMNAIEARSELCPADAWKALLLMDLAELCLREGNAQRAVELLDVASAIDSPVSFRARIALEEANVRAGAVEGAARALEGQGDLIAAALEDPARGDDAGIPPTDRTLAHAADAWLRSGRMLRRLGDHRGAVRLFQRASAALPGSVTCRSALLDALENSGDLQASGSAARAELERDPQGEHAVHHWLRVAEAAAERQDWEQAQEAVTASLGAEPGGAVAHALAAAYAFEQGDARILMGVLGRLAALVQGQSKRWMELAVSAIAALRLNDFDASLEAWRRAREAGAPSAWVATTGMCLAQIAQRLDWAEEAASVGVQAFAGMPEEAMWLFEQGRAKLLFGDPAGAGVVFSRLKEQESTAWLGRVLGVVGAMLDEDARARPLVRVHLLEELAELFATDARCGLSLLAVLHRGSAEPGSVIPSLQVLHERYPEEAVVSLLLWDRLSQAGKVPEAARVLSAAASQQSDAAVARAFRLTAWLQCARSGSWELATGILGNDDPLAVHLDQWVARRQAGSALEARFACANAFPDAPGAALTSAFERWGLYAVSGDLDRPEVADVFDFIEEESTAPAMMTAAAVGRLLSPRAPGGRASLERALDVLEASGESGARIARAEWFRLARSAEGDRAWVAARARMWAEGEGQLAPALEWLAAARASGDASEEAAALGFVADRLDAQGGAGLRSEVVLEEYLRSPMHAPTFLDGDSVVGQLTNLEIAPAGSDPRRRSAALHGVSDKLGSEVQIDAIALAGWSDLAAGDHAESKRCFEAVLAARSGDLAAWEGLRAACQAMGDKKTQALAAIELAKRCSQVARVAHFWEEAGLLLLSVEGGEQEGEFALEQAFRLDGTRLSAFDPLFRAVRKRNEDERLLELIALRLVAASSQEEIAKLYWERARVLRRKGDKPGSLEALSHVTELEPDHVGAIALLAEIRITEGAFLEAAPLLTRLASMETTPRQQRLLSGIAAVDIYERQLQRPDEALRVLEILHRARLTNVQVKERMARIALRTKEFSRAGEILEELMIERSLPAERLEAARLAMAIWRDKAPDAARAARCAEHALQEDPTDRDAIEYVLADDFVAANRQALLAAARSALVTRIAGAPLDEAAVILLAKVSQREGHLERRRAALGAMVALGHPEHNVQAEIDALDARTPQRARIILDASAIQRLCAPGDQGPLADLFTQLAPTVAEAFGPSLSTLGAVKKERLDPKSGHPLRLAVAQWMGALGLSADFSVYHGGTGATQIRVVVEKEPSIVIGREVQVPLSALERSRLARELFALRRGTTAVLHQDNEVIESLVVAACREAGLNVAEPRLAVYQEVSRSLHKAISGKVRKTILPICQAYVGQRIDLLAWMDAARRSADRFALVAAGDVSLVLAGILGIPRAELSHRLSSNERAKDLLAFALSDAYLEVRRELGMVVG